MSYLSCFRIPHHRWTFFHSLPQILFRFTHGTFIFNCGCIINESLIIIFCWSGKGQATFLAFTISSRWSFPDFFSSSHHCAMKGLVFGPRFITRSSLKLTLQSFLFSFKVFVQFVGPVTNHSDMKTYHIRLLGSWTDGEWMPFEGGNGGNVDEYVVTRLECKVWGPPDD